MAALPTGLRDTLPPPLFQAWTLAPLLTKPLSLSLQFVIGHPTPLTRTFLNLPPPLYLYWSYADVHLTRPSWPPTPPPPLDPPLCLTYLSLLLHTPHPPTPLLPASTQHARTFRGPPPFFHTLRRPNNQPSLLTQPPRTTRPPPFSRSTPLMYFLWRSAPIGTSPPSARPSPRVHTPPPSRPPPQPSSGRISWIAPSGDSS